MLEMVERQISRVINLPKLDKEIKFREEVVVHPGSPFSVFVVEREDGSKEILKIGSPRHIAREVAGYALVPEIFPIPRMLSHSKWTVEYEYFAGRNLFQLALEDSSLALPVHLDFLGKTSKAWLLNNNHFGEIKTVYDHAKITDKNLGSIARKLQKSEAGFSWNSNVVVNGKAYPSLSETFGLARSLICNPERVVLDSGDANGYNILVGDNSQWVMVDLEKTGWYDPAYIIARQLGQWDLMVRDPNKVTYSYRKANQSLDSIDFDLDYSGSVLEMSKAVLVLGEYLTSLEMRHGDNVWPIIGYISYQEWRFSPLLVFIDC